MGVVLLVCALLPLVVFALLSTQHIAAATRATADHRLRGISYTSAMAVAARLSAAQAIVQALTARDVGDGAAIRQQISNSRAFKSVALVARDGADTLSPTQQPSGAQLAALAAGQTVLMPAVLQGQLPSIFLLREVSAGGKPRLAYFELAPDWLWNDLSIGHDDVLVALVDVREHVLESSVRLPEEIVRMFAHQIDLEGERREEIRALGWQAGEQGWQGVLTHVPLVNERITAAPWAVIAFMREPSWLASTVAVQRALPVALLVSVLLAAAAALYLTRLYVPVLAALRAGLDALQDRRYSPLPIAGRDEPRSLLRALNRSAASLQEQLRALETLGEIDQLLLGSAGLEQVLDAILSRVQAVTRCHSVGIALRDGDAPGRGRVYLAAAGLNELPVSRIALDDDMLATLAAETDGLTIARCEDGRHSFLRPLQDTGAEIFWVWPVIVGERVEAILSVGYREVPAADPHILRCGGAFAARLAIALSKSARDEQLYRQAHFDPLTALPNRLLFRERLSQELASSSAGGSRGALLYIDLDHFKKVNDSVGHGAGDQLLNIVAQRLRASVKDGDTVARLGGDEFTVILRNVQNTESAGAVAERIVESLQLPVSIGGRDHHICASIGITLFPDDATSIEDLVHNADAAMYRAKDLGRGRTMFFERSMSVKLAPPSDSGLQRALRRREFSLFYQPQFAVADGTLAGIEALLRWNTPRDGVRQPDEFVPAAEESGLIVDIGGWVLEAACTQLVAWRERGIAPPRLSLNIAPQQLRHADFAHAVRRTLDKFALPAEMLEFELTESIFADEGASIAVSRLAQVGVRIALDGFGSGYASLGHLRQHPISIVKIDRRFLADVPYNPASATLVETIIVMAHALGKRVVAEGIESIEQLDFLRERRCDLAQGFYLARPLAAASMTELLHAGSASREEGEQRAAG